MIVGGKPDTAPMATANNYNDTEMIVSGNPLSPLAAGDPDFRACEKSSGDDAIAACDRAIASGKFTARGLSYLYSDRGFMRMQTGDIDIALADLNEAARIDSTNFYAFWNRGAVYAVKGDVEGARADFTRALSLNPDLTSKARIEEALNAITSSQSAPTTPDDGSVITDPSKLWGSQEGISGSAASTYESDTGPTYGTMGPDEAMPASPFDRGGRCPLGQRPA